MTEDDIFVLVVVAAPVVIVAVLVIVGWIMGLLQNRPVRSDDD